MTRIRIGSTFLALISMGFLVGCASRGPVSGPNLKLSSQPDTGQLVDYLHFAGISYGDTFDEVVSLFGDPTSIDLNGEEYSFASASYEIQGERCLDVFYDKATRRVENIHVSCERVRAILLNKQVDDPKLELFAQHRDSILDKYGPPSNARSDTYEYEFAGEGDSEGEVDFSCYPFWDSACKSISVLWFYPMSETEMAQALADFRQEAKKISEGKRKKIRQLLEIMKVADQSKQVFEDVLSAMSPKMPEEVREDLLGEADFEQLIELTVHTYAKHLTETEIDDLIAFYSSPTGRSFVEKQPLILRESMAAGLEWGKALARKIRERQAAKKKRTIGP